MDCRTIGQAETKLTIFANLYIVLTKLMFLSSPLITPLNKYLADTLPFWILAERQAHQIKALRHFYHKPHEIKFQLLKEMQVRIQGHY